MENIIYGIWALIPIFFFLQALWFTLKKGAFSSNQKKAEIFDLWKQCGFVSVCVLVAYFIYKKIYITYFSPTVIQFVPDFVAQFLLLPITLLLAATIIGPSKEIRISKLPDLKQQRKK
jgi:hypothetical protein